MDCYQGASELGSMGRLVWCTYDLPYRLNLSFWGKYTSPIWIWERKNVNHFLSIGIF